MKHSVGSKPAFGLPHKSASIQQQRRSLPIYAKREELLQHIDTHSVTVLVGETGSGKTTQIPQYLIEHGYGKKGVVCCTQPRRVAAETLAARVAEEVGCQVGEEVGYTVRFHDVTSSLTRIKYMTDGMLLREALLDDSFQRYSVIVLDEAHERSINTDLLFAIVRKALRKHPSLKVLVTSATLETEKFCAYFGVDAPFMIEGRTFPVDMYYLAEPTSDYVRTALQTVMKIHLEEPPGDILVFFTGQEEIEMGGEHLYSWMTALRKQVDTPLPDLLILPLTATMPQDVQSKVFEPTPPGCRKVVLATNVAETSITISNLYYVIDSGFCKQSIFDPRKGMEQLKIVPISQAQAKQRSGRAGRIGPGKCYRIYTEEQFEKDLEPETVPDIMRANLFHVALQLKAMGLDLVQMELMDAPSQEAVVVALEKLRYLEALDDDGLLTPLGGRMAQLSIDPSQSKTLLTAVDMGCSDPILTIVSMLAVQKRGIFYRPRDRQEEADAARRQFAQPEGDHLTLLAVYDAWVAHGMSEEWSREHFLKHRMLVEARDTREQLHDMITRRGARQLANDNADNLTQVRKAITAGYFFNVAKRVDSYTRSYVTISERREVYMHPSSVLLDEPPKYVLYDDIRITKKEYMSELLVIEPQWLLELAPAYYSKPPKGRRLTRAQEAERFTPILKSWETGSSWRMSKQKRQKK
ncbi:ATP-dependent RNA helicase DHX8/PRP22 [Strigomonas culicis]|uniref:RNA helicase n=1 Tax=Strigomonas culicis TaxID=28005 RepID=S9V3F8_9TRYP|nr:ATP-dependent RNA helicase DHX8/PRP22 [Strigomonas culicis]|eukprot:EPY21456.1 ATP-dependent RNA helicase DHX8/PRP22 [Strigomonas culicis]